MLYLNDEDVRKIKIEWNENIQVIRDAVMCIKENDYAQPVKPYLRYGNMKNRIIAMPAFAGGNINMAGIKWIASFPDNIQRKIPRAHCVVVLNDPATGVPVGTLNSGSISAIRTASVSGLILKRYIEGRKIKSIKLGISGFGPIGRYHLEMCNALLHDIISEVFLYDINKVDVINVPENLKDKVTVVDSWEKAYSDADVFITCTVSKDRYINLKPKSGSLHLNVSLRDYTTDTFQWFSDAIVVDDWEEVCRENTDIEAFHKDKKLQREDVKNIGDVVFSEYFNHLKDEQAILFNPMGMAVFDIAISQAYLNRATDQKIGTIV